MLQNGAQGLKSIIVEATVNLKANHCDLIRENLSGSELVIWHNLEWNRDASMRRK